MLPLADLRMLLVGFFKSPDDVLATVDVDAVAAEVALMGVAGGSRPRLLLV